MATVTYISTSPVFSGTRSFSPCSTSTIQFRLRPVPQHLDIKRPSALLLGRAIHTRRDMRALASVTAPAVGAESVKPAIILTEKALKHLQKMRGEIRQDMCLRIGVRQGGCSGMSYTMDFEQQTNVRPDDSIIDYEGFIMVCDPKSLLFLYGMQLDYSDALIGGGFSFSNPNASSTCGCGKSFAA